MIKSEKRAYPRVWEKVERFLCLRFSITDSQDPKQRRVEIMKHGEAGAAYHGDNDVFAFASSVGEDVE